MNITGSAPLWVAARTLLAIRVDDFFRRWKKVRETFDPEDIHDLRVSSRRLREGLLLFTPNYPPDAVSRVVKKVRKVTRILGQMRNTDEALIFFRELSEELDSPSRESLAALIALFEEQRNGERKKLKEGLSALDPAAMNSLFTRTVNSPRLFSPLPNGIDPFMHLSAFARESMEQRLADLLALVPAARDEENIAAQHQLRIAVKRYRYRLEIISFLIASGYEELYGEVKNYQETLGKMHDLDVFAEIVRGHEYLPTVEVGIMNAITGRRGSFYASFTEMLERMPLETIGERVRSAL